MHDLRRSRGGPNGSWARKYSLPAYALLVFLGMVVIHELMLHRTQKADRQMRVETQAGASKGASKLSKALAPTTTNFTEIKLLSTQLMDCIKFHQPKYNVTSWKSAMSETNYTALSVGGIWWSNRSATVPMTVVTQLSFDRVGQLIQQCKSWAGPISAVLYLPLVLEKGQPEGVPKEDPGETLLAAIEKAGELHSLMDSTLVCQLDLMLAYEYFEDDHASMLYPINTLRNYARMQARTPLVGLFDADMLVSRSLFKKLLDPTTVDWMLNFVANKSVLVIPGFVTYAKAGLSREYIADRMSIANKSVIEMMYRSKIMSRFDPKDEGHNATQYERWFNSSKPYRVKYKYRYEPWVIASRHGVPFYDSRFRGYGQNKIIHCEYMNFSGYNFVVDSDSWLVHRAHSLTRAKLQHAKDASIMKASRWKDEWFSNVYGHTAKLGNMSRRAMRAGTYHPPLDTATIGCLKELQWWKDLSVPD